MLSGSVDACATLYRDARVQPQLAALAEKLHWEESSLRVAATNDAAATADPLMAPAASHPLEVKEDEAVAFLGPADGKLVRGVDGNVYALDFVRSQPVDVYWVQEQIRRGETGVAAAQTVLRPELVEQLSQQREEVRVQAEGVREVLGRVAKGETVEGLTEEQIGKLKEQLPMLEKSCRNRD